MKDIFKLYLQPEGNKASTFWCLVTTVIIAVLGTMETRWTALGVKAGSLEEASGYLFLVIATNVVVTVCRYVQKLLFNKCRFHCNTLLMEKLARKIAYADYKFFSVYSTARLNTIMGSLAGISNITANSILCVDKILFFVSSLAGICTVDYRLVFPLVVIYVVGSFSLKKIYVRQMSLEKATKDLKHKRNTEMHLLINGFAEVRSIDTAEYHINNIKDITDKWYEITLTKMKLAGLSWAVGEIVSGLMTVIIMSVGIILVATGKTDSAMVMTLLVFAGRLIDPLYSILDLTESAAETMPWFNTYKEVLNFEDTIEDGDIDLVSFDGDIKFHNVEFGYETSDTVLKDFNLTIKKGQKVGICGASGGGKSTLLKLLERSYDVRSGEVTIDGIDIKEITLSSLRKYIGVVHQKNHIFEGTIYDNIRYGCWDASEDDVINAIKKANLYDFIQGLPNKMNTLVGPDGLKLSGGQQQRIAIARLFLKNPEIVILDEATSALDNESEHIIQESLELLKDKTVVIVAHRLTTIENCDKIVVLDNHTIAEEGSHEQLMKLDGIYAKLRKMHK